MNFFEKILYNLQFEMNKPEPYGWFHLMWIIITILSILILFKLRKNYNEKQLKIVLGIYGIVALIFELIKQLIWSFNYNEISKIITWDYQWYAAPFQLCTTPIYISLICLFLKDSKIRNSMLSYLSFITILGGLLTILIPNSCFVSDTLINIHTMWLHCGSFVISIYLIISGAIKINKQNFRGAFAVFLFFILIAEFLNIVIYNTGILNGETFNMFYISPYFISTLPVFDVIQQKLPFILFLLTYIFAIFIGAIIVYYTSYKIKETIKKYINFKKDNKEKTKIKKSGSAIFMYFVIFITIIISIICFYLYYGKIYKNEIILWTGITSFTIMYHFWVRIIMGNVSKLFKKHINYKQKWFKERKFEKNFYKILGVKKWKDKALTYNPESFSLKEHSLEEIANTMVKSELDHWINEIISLSTLLFPIMWGEFWIFLITAIAAMMFDSQFIIIQRYNRPRVIKILEKIEREKNNKKIIKIN